MHLNPQTRVRSTGNEQQSDKVNVGVIHSDTKEFCSKNKVLQTYIDSCNKESERYAVYLDHSNSHLNNVANSLVDSDSITPHRKIVRKIFRKMIRPLSKKMRKIRV